LFKVGVISDSHRKLSRAILAVDLLIEKGAEYFIHAGDIVEIKLLEYIKSKNIPYSCVFGNNDGELVAYQEEYNIQKEPYTFKLKNRIIKLMHKPHYLSNDADIVIFGHTHMFNTSYTNGTLFLNPGELCARNKNLSECVLLKIKKSSYVVDYYKRVIKTKEWIKKKHRFILPI
jgi:putative phosphoesterase